MASPRAAAEMGATIFAWYATSVVATNTSKSLGVHWSALTLAQLLVASSCSLFVLRGLKLRPHRPIGGAGELKLTAWLAAAFVGGFVTLNGALALMPVSLVMTLRATEPLFTLVLSDFVCATGSNPNDRTSYRAALGLVPVVTGAALSSMGDAEFTLAGCVACAASNACFAARGVLTKWIKQLHSADDYSLFLHINVIGAAAGALLVAARELHSRATTGAPAPLFVAGSAYATAGASDGELLRTLLLNGIAFWAYLQLSWLVLGKVSAVTHSVCNSMRRPVIIFFGWLQFGNYISPINAAGIALASGGALLYAHLKRAPPPLKVLQEKDDMKDDQEAAPHAP